MLTNHFYGLPRLLLTALVLAGSSLAAWADSEVHVETAGTLASLLPTTESTLRVTGTINGTDCKYLRELTLEGSVTSLDLSGVRIVSGGTAYYESYRTENDVLGQSMFRECSRLRSILLPTTITSIQAGAFSSSGLREVEIPNSVTRLGMDAFAYCGSLTKVVIGSRATHFDQGVFYRSAVRQAYVKPLAPPATPAYFFSSNPTIHVYSSSLDDYRQSSWAQFGSLVAGLEDLYPEEEDSSAAVNRLCATYFEDAACTRLRPDYQAMTDATLAAAMAEGGMPPYMAAIAVKVKNQAWAAYEQDFRIHAYSAYSDAAYWNAELRSTGGSFMGNPTGIYTPDDQPLYVFVDDDVPADATLYMAGCAGNDLVTTAKAGQRLHKGLNIIDGQKDALFYLLYTADTRARSRMLSEWPAIKVHIEGGTVNGYYDVSRHTPQDYTALLRAATHERFTVKGTQALFHFKRATFRQVWPRDIDRSICWFDSLTVWEKELMGFCQSVASGQRAGAPYYLTGGEAIFPIYYNNPNFAIEGESADAGYANSSPFRTSYNSADCVAKSFDVTRSDHDEWCAAHECGHNNQGVINLEGGTEVSNNLFSNVVRYLTGTVTSSGLPLATTMNDYASHTPYFVRDISSQQRMYYQLFLYYHLAQRNTAFFPTLFQELRKDPLTLWTNTYNSSLKFVRKVCEVAQEDLTDFFAAWGFFEPCTNLSVDDYGQHTLTVRQTSINRTLAEIAQYPRNRQILFVEDRADYVPTTGFLTTAGQHRRDADQVGQCANVGQFTSYLPAHAQPASYTYLQADSLYSMSGTGGVGFILLAEDGTLRYAANTYNFCVPSTVPRDYTLYAIDADGTLHPAVPSTGRAVQRVETLAAGTLADTLSAEVIKAIVSGTLNGSDLAYLRQLTTRGNLAALDLSAARIASGGPAYYQTYRSTANALGERLFHQCRQLIGVRLPESVTKIGANAFSSSGLREVAIPDGVTSVGGDAFAYCSQLATVVVGAGVRTLAQGVFYSSPVRHAYVKALTPPAVASYLFSSKPVIHVYASALAAYRASAWADYGTLVGDLEDYEDYLTGIHETPQSPALHPQPSPSGAHQPAPVDLTGRPVREPGRGLYIIRGRKWLVP